MNKKAETERWSGTEREGERGSTSGPLERERESGPGKAFSFVRYF